MTKTPLHLLKNLIAVVLLNLLGILSASAHEVFPSIADITITDNQIEIEIRLMAEAVLAEIDLSETKDTNGSARVAEYDRFRALEAQALAEA
ncbi:MAG: HupE/UreJ family protein, partial [Rhodobacteraceae bacterium]|nr:HupE/UreJ family protein [Paracoccaceae bacterium]